MSNYRLQEESNTFVIKYQEQLEPKQRKKNTQIEKDAVISNFKSKKSRYNELHLANQSINVDLSKSQQGQLIKKRNHRQNIRTQRLNRQSEQNKTIEPQKYSFNQKTEKTISYSQQREKIRSQLSISETCNQLSRIPIEYCEEKEGNLSQSYKGRVLYRGYSGKNSFYFISTIKQVNDSIPNPIQSGDDLWFNSKFECGNLSLAIRSSKKDYILFMRQDTNTHGLRQWYYFQVYCQKATTIKFKIYKFSKKHSLYKKGMKPYIKRKKQQWHQGGQKVRYLFDEDRKCFYLQFEFTFKDKQLVQVAGMPVYGYYNLVNFINLIKEQSKVKVQNLGFSLGGLEIPLISIANSKTQQSLKYFNSSKKHAIIIVSRTHPSETCSNFTVESIIYKILSMNLLQDIFDFFIVPMVNPDGVFMGNHRTNLVGVDLNRKFNTADKMLYPQVQSIRLLISKIKNTHQIEFFLDLHGHSAQKNIFAFASKYQISSLRYLKSRILPKLLSNQISSFKHEQCLFNIEKTKKNTARVYLSKRYEIDAITFEQSFGLLDIGRIGVENWNNFGVAIVQSLFKYAQIIKGDVKEGLTITLKNEIEMDKAIEKQRMDKQIQKQKQIIAKIKNKTEKVEQNQRQIVNVFQNQTNKIQKFNKQTEKQNKFIQSQIIQQDSELDSAEQQLECNEQQIQIIRKNIVFNSNKANKRQSMFVHDQNLVYKKKQEMQKIHENKRSIGMRILRMKEKTKQLEKQIKYKEKSVSPQIANRSLSGKSDFLDIIRQKNQTEINLKEKITIFDIKLPNIYKFIH